MKRILFILIMAMSMAGGGRAAEIKDTDPTEPVEQLKLITVSGNSYTFSGEYTAGCWPDAFGGSKEEIMTIGKTTSDGTPITHKYYTFKNNKTCFDNNYSAWKTFATIWPKTRIGKINGWQNISSAAADYSGNSPEAKDGSGPLSETITVTLLNYFEFYDTNFWVVDDTLEGMVTLYRGRNMGDHGQPSNYLGNWGKPMTHTAEILNCP